ncbi:MAG TPA: UDP-N-acetylglucosamine 1-carboxyvinyltransferase, partial [Microterricola sp.]
MNSLGDDAKNHGSAVGLSVDKITIHGGKPLVGRIELKGAKNLVTKAMVAA